MSATAGTAPGSDGYFSGARLLTTDMGVMLVLLNQARYRVVERMFGVSEENSWLVTAIAVAALAQAVQGKAGQVIRVPPGPSLGDTLVGTGMLRAAAHGIAGDWARDTPQFGTLIAIAVVGSACRPLLRLSFRDVKAVSHRMRADFEHRYGHLIRPNRARRADPARP
jgi:hypothetical protein